MVAPRPISKVGEIFTDMKQKLTTDQQSFVVHRIQCKMCRKFYIGETTWCLCDRCKMHESDVRNKEKSPKKRLWKKKVRKKGVLKIHEANQILLHEDRTVNFKSDAEHITPVFYTIIKNNSKLPNVNPPQLTSYGTSESNATDVLAVGIPSVN